MKTEKKNKLTNHIVGYHISHKRTIERRVIIDTRMDQIRTQSIVPINSAKLSERIPNGYVLIDRK